MGGSFALALKRQGLVSHIIGYDPNSEALDLAISMGVIDSVADSARECAIGSDVNLLAVPVSATEMTLTAILPVLSKDTLVMDIGSTKQRVSQIARNILGKLDLANCFVPAHPICGREVSGVQHALSDLFQGKKAILTPPQPQLQAADFGQLARAKEIWQSIGCEVIMMDPQEHDATFAAVSHLPHFAAFAAVLSLVEQKQNEGREYMQFAGTGFRDFSRIAASDPVMWRDILLSNKQEVLLQSQLLRQQLERLEALVSAGDGTALQACISRASTARAEWPSK